MVQKLEQAGESEVAKELRIKPMLTRSDHFFKENVGRVRGELVDFNRELFKTFPVKEEDIAKKLSFFVDWSSKKTEIDLSGLFMHSRSLFLPIKFSDREGEVYNYIDIKGLGMPRKANDAHMALRRKGPEEVWGLLDYEDARRDWNISSQLIKKGVRTSAPLAIISITEVITPEGKVVSVEKMKKWGSMGEEFRPVLYLRAFPEVMRIADARVEDIEKFAKVHGMKNAEEYMKWFVKEVAENLARMHNHGLVHKNIIGHNLTLDGRIVDNDTVETVKMHSNNRFARFFFEKVKHEAFSRDVEHAARVIMCELVFQKHSDKLKLVSLFLDEYIKNRESIDADELRRYRLL